MVPQVIWEGFEKVVKDRVFDDSLVRSSFYFVIGEDACRLDEAVALIKANRPTLGLLISAEVFPVVSGVINA